MTKGLKTFFIVAAITATSMIFVLSGFWVGKYYAVTVIRNKIDSYYGGETLGQLNIDKANLSAYSNKPTKKELDNISWGIMNIPAPFVMHIPKPGKRFNSTINNLGMRSDRDVKEKKAGTYRIFITGGSTAFGSGAPSQDRTIGSYLEKMLNEYSGSNSKIRYEVFTAANPAWSSTHERIFTENIITDLAPDLVIAFSGNNDVHWGYSGRNVLYFWSYYDVYVLGILNTVREFSGYEKFYESVKNDNNRIAPEVVTSRLKNNISLAAYSLNSNHAKYLFCLQPTRSVTKRCKPTNKDVSIYFNRCYQLFRKNLSHSELTNYLFYDMSKMFDKLPTPGEYYLDSYHFGDKGNKLIAQNIFNYIIKAKLI